MAEDQIIMDEESSSTGLRRSKRNKYHLDVAAMLKSGSSVLHRDYSPPASTKKWATQRPNLLISQNSKVSPNKRYVKKDETLLKYDNNLQLERKEIHEYEQQRICQDQEYDDKITELPEQTVTYTKQSQSVYGRVRDFDFQLPEQLLEEDNFDSASSIHIDGGQSGQMHENNNLIEIGPLISSHVVPPQRQNKRQRKVPLRHLDYTNEESDIDEDALFKCVKVEYTLTDGIRTVDEHSCPKCPAIFESRVGLTNHLKLHGSRKEFPCELCDFSCTNKKTMRQHRRVHGIIKRSRIKLTKRVNVLNVDSPIAQQHAELTEDSNNLNQSEEIKNEQIDEEELEEGEEKFIVVKSFVDVNNGANYDNDTMPVLEEQEFVAQKRKINKRIKHSRSDVKKIRDLPVGFYKKGSRIYDRNTVKCPYCPFRTQSKIRLAPHSLGHTRETGFECSICQFKSESSGFLRRHCQLHLPLTCKWPPDYVRVTDSSAQTTVSNQQNEMELIKENSISNILSQEDFDKNEVIVQINHEMNPENENNVEAEFLYPMILKTTVLSNSLMNQRKKFVHLKKPLLRSHLYKFACVRCGFLFPSTLFGITLHKLRHHMQKDILKTKLYQELLAERIARKPEQEASNQQDISESFSEDRMTNDKSATSGSTKIFNCPHCPYTTTQVLRLQKHENKHYVKAEQQCIYCSFSCRSLDILTQHLRLHENDGNHLLDEQILNSTVKCDESETGQFNDNSKLLSIRKNETLFCQYCPYKSKHNCDMKAHIKMHEERRKYTCSHCTYSTMRQNALIAHEKLHQNIGIIKGAASRRVNSIYSRKNNGVRGQFLGTRMQHIHNGVYFYRCVVKKCAAEFSYCSELAQHARHHQIGSWTTQKNLGCTICGFKTSIEKRIRAHQMVHKADDEKNVRSIEGLFYCKSCPFVSANYAKFWNHRQKHKRSARLTCTFCSFSTGSTQCYSEHILLHNNDKMKNLQIPINSDLTDKFHFTKMSIKSEEQIKILQSCEEFLPFQKEKYEKLSADLPIAQLKMLGKIGKYKIDEPESSGSSTSSKEKNLKCSECPYKTDDSVLLKLHAEMHYSRSPRPFACTLCSFSCFSAESLHTHLALHSSTAFIMDSLQQQSQNNQARNGLYYQCSQCNFKTTEMETFLTHRKEHVQLLQQRLMTIIKRSASGNTAMDNEFKDKSKLVRGWRSIDKQHLCPRCSFRCDSVQAFTQHWEHHRINQLRQGIFKCSICDYNSDSKNVVIFHEKNHHLDVPLKSLCLIGRTTNEQIISI